MRTASACLLVVLALAGCAAQSSTKPVEYLDDRTTLTVGALKEPIELVPKLRSSMIARSMTNRVSFAYLGPVEWDSAGHYGYGLWVHVATGSDLTVADIRAPSAITLELDDGSVTLVPIDAPQMGRAPYQPVASWGQTSYFELDVKMLRRMAASHTLNLGVQGTDGKVVGFVSHGDTSAVLGEFIRARALTDD